MRAAVWRRYGAWVVVAVATCVATPTAGQRSLRVEPPAVAAQGERRTALVIGNSNYAFSPLRNPANDARAIGKSLGELGFEVDLLLDATASAMRRAMRAFGTKIANGGVGIFYYAGHGMQVRGRNFLIPVNADIQAEDEVEDQAIDANFVLAKMDTAKNALNIMILDACRNNPFARSFRSAQQGLAQMDAPSGTLIAFATAPGSVAADGDGDNGLYTKHLLTAMREPGLPIEQLFKQVRIGVTRETRDRQIPWESSSLKGDFYFIAPDPTRLTEAQRKAQQAAVDAALRAAEDRAARERDALRRQAEAEREALRLQAERERSALEQKMQALMERLLQAQREAQDAQRLRNEQQRAELQAQRRESGESSLVASIPSAPPRPVPPTGHAVISTPATVRPVAPPRQSPAPASVAESRPTGDGVPAPAATDAAPERRDGPGAAPAGTVAADRPSVTDPAPEPAAATGARPGGEPERTDSERPAGASPGQIALASAAPTPVVAARAMPNIGDWWTYRVRNLEQEWRRQVQDIVEVRGVTRDGILAGASRGLIEPGEWVHTEGPYVIGGTQGAVTFAPHLGLFHELRTGERWEDIKFTNVPFCDAERTCRISGEVRERERVSVPAGDFEATRIELEMVWEPIGFRSRIGWGKRRYTVWYADAAKRVVKVSGRDLEGSRSFEPDVDVELIAFELK